MADAVTTTLSDDDLARLKDPFEADAIEWRIGQSGKTRDGKPWAKVLAYLTNRAIMDRLDEVCGPGHWRNEYAPTPNDPKRESLLCGISIRIGGAWVTKWDGANNTDFEPIKGGISDAMKRAAVQWGIGRYLYGLGESWADCTEDTMRGQDGWRYAKTKDGAFWWKPPALPGWALPDAKPTPRGKDAAKQAAMAAAGGKLKPASELPAKREHRRGDNPDPAQWYEPPQEVVDAVARGEDPLWFVQGYKALRHLGGARTAPQTRALLVYLLPDRTPTPEDVVRDPVLAREVWGLIVDTVKGGTPLTRLVADAIKAAEARAV